MKKVVKIVVTISFAHIHTHTHTPHKATGAGNIATTHTHTHTHTHTPMKSTFKLINLTRQGKVFGVRLQGRLKQTSKGRAKKRV